MAELPIWYPSKQPIYDITKSWAENVEQGPLLQNQPIPERIWKPKQEWSQFLGHKVASKLGVPAGPLLSAEWIDVAAKLGFDVVTYKTIRSNEFFGHPAPNVIFVEPNEVSENLKANSNSNNTICAMQKQPQSVSELAITNSYGMPSKNREFLQKDIPKANECLAEGQVMIVSVVGTPSSTSNKAEDYTNFVRDFAETALFAKNCGAKIVEANFSCPNVITGEGPIYHSPDSVRDISTAIRSALGDTPLVLKVGTYQDSALMKNVLKVAYESKVNAICGINSISMKVVSPSTQKPALGDSRLVSGICGVPIRPSALNFVSQARRIIKEEQYELSILACGGVTEPHHFDEFLQAGADIAMSATGMWWDPYLAARYHKIHEK